MLSRRGLLGTAAGGGAALAAGLGRPALPRAQTLRRLRFVPMAAYSSPDPIWTTAIVVQTHALMVWDTLYGVDIGLRPHPQMCAGHELSGDGLSWTFTLRDGLLFHDGEPVRGRDVVASIGRWSQRNSFGQLLAAATAEMTAPDDRRFRIRLKRPFPQMLYALGSQGCFIMPERMARVPASEPVKEFVGSGPFRFVPDQYVSGARAVYARFDRYQPRQEAPDYLSGGKAVHFDEVEWSIQPDPGTAASALQSGEVDWVDQPLFDLVPMLQASRGVTVEQLDPFGLIGIIGLNHLQPPFNNPKLRRALLPAIDQKQYIAAVLGEQAKYASLPVGYFTVGSPMASEAGMAALAGPRDLDLAARLVRESGYAGEPVLLMDPADQPQMHAMAELTASIFRRIGLTVDVVAMDWGSLLSRRAVKAPPAQGGWSVFNTRQAGLNAADPASVQLKGNGDKAWFGWPTAPRLDECREAWFQAGDPAEQKRIAADMQQAAFEAVPYIPVGQWSQPTAWRSDLTGFLKSANPLFWNLRRTA
ncbi:ABC transporter substrate-binding protein [Teichococcus oryzae]|uniref:ABC transporter substrate-binding protein n=1 Tax=Teichococcus oryzae TaxID=1608942 RepID=A0A5B2TI11_9PROT|nr:ABC transporter substrate-binding protein [Pseudoroseomonas oryzae]KAA2213829.1 ABC transporter substrate-binding protein [Pseudoroseomonas oryzae]